MKIDVNKIKKHKKGFVVLCIMFLLGIISITKINDLRIETEEIEAVVVKSYEVHDSIHTHKSGGWRMNIEWEDLDGNVHEEGNLKNSEHLDAGDKYRIKVDAKTHSQRILSSGGNIIMVVMGVCLCFASVILTIMFFSLQLQN